MKVRLKYFYKIKIIYLLQIIKRAVTKRPVKKVKKHKKDNKTAFTEEDFKKFEDEYFDE